jgi:two-component system response regulator RegA
MSARITETAPRERLLLVDDGELLLQQLERALVRRGFAVTTAANYRDAVGAARTASVHQRPFDRAVVDLRLDDGHSGLEVLAELKALHAATRVVILTGYGSMATAVDALRLGAENIVAKPADADDILAAFDRQQHSPLHGSDRTYEPPTLARAEWEHIQRVLSDCGGNISEAARRLGLHRRTLQRKLQKFPPST